MILNDRDMSPRPDLYRENWISLNGEWSFAFDDKEEGIKSQWFKTSLLSSEKIIVPFCYQCSESGIGDVDIHKHLWYEKRVPVTDLMKEKRVWLHFGAADRNTRVWINGTEAGNHVGGFTPFSLSVSEYLHADDEEMRITVYCNDDNSADQVRGKQHWNRETDRCWYTATSGIWQNVWLELTGEIRVERIALTPDIDQNTVSAVVCLSEEPENGRVCWSVSLDEKKLLSGEQNINKKRDRFVVPFNRPDCIDNRIGLWEPEHPVLYDMKIEFYSGEQLLDCVETSFGMRKIEQKNGRVFLNHVPVYQKMILDQGYWEDSLMTPKTAEDLLKDLLLVKEMGFTGVRKHQKLEDPRFLHYADKLGVLVWEEMPSNYEFSDEGVREIANACVEMVERDYNHPSIITWVPFNESWGIRDVLWDKRQQNFAEGIYHILHAMDPTRLVSTNDGWEAVRTDIIGIHDYESSGEKLSDKFKDLDYLMSTNAVEKMVLSDGKMYNGEPVFLSEFGGIALEDGNAKSWGYNKKAADKDEYLNKLENLFVAVQRISYLNGYCYTQLTDVEQETNGILDMKRNPKVNLHEIRRIVEQD